MVITRDADLALQVRLLRGYGQHPTRQEVPPELRHTLDDQEYLVEGYNLRLDSLQAALVRVKLRHLPAWQAERQTLADRYARHFAGSVVLLPDRNRVRQALRERGIATQALYVPPVHLHPVHAHLGLGPGSFPVAEDLAAHLLGLPMYPGLAPEAVDEVAAAVLESASPVGSAPRTPTA
jgi:dTDP-4-amino-4,6-dideoxygalactose transaminase